MKKIAIISKVVCSTSIAILRHFLAQDYKIELIIVEKTIRKKYSENELNYRKAHDKFNKKIKKYGLSRRVLRILWDILVPMHVKPLIEYHSNRIPFIRKKSVEYVAKKNNISVKTVKKHSSIETRDLLVDHNIEQILFGSSNWLIKPPILNIPNCNIINVHPGKLPDFKGLDSLFWTIEKGGEIGCTAFYINETMDGGDVLKFYSISPEKDDTTVKIQRKMTALKPQIMFEVVKGLEKNTIVPKPQAENGFICKPMSFEQLIETEKKLQILIKKTVANQT